MLANYDSWNVYEGASEGSGRSEKIWLANSITQEIGLFKFPKSLKTTEHVSEKLSSDIATLLCLPCAKVEIGEYHGRIGSMSYLINAEEEILIEGIYFICSIYPRYSSEKMYDEENNEYYSLEMILKSIEPFNVKTEFIKLLIFDFLIGNTDRHQNNWALLISNNTEHMSPLYDNGSSLCCYIEENKIDLFIGKDNYKFQSLVNSKSKSRIRLDKNLKKEPTHLEVIIYIKNHYYKECFDFVEKIITVINDFNLNNLLSCYDNTIITDKRKYLIKKFLLEKINLLSQTFRRQED